MTDEAQEMTIELNIETQETFGTCGIFVIRGMGGGATTEIIATTETMRGTTSEIIETMEGIQRGNMIGTTERGPVIAAEEGHGMIAGLIQAKSGKQVGVPLLSTMGEAIGSHHGLRQRAKGAPKYLKFAKTTV
mmetsp:Transcript_18561/g.29594  ORF Transcript_18561/g.29594 Transcript_18561/m.29594 type:complete len:133 (-) Transcript_18561:525-923(-)